MIEQIIKIIHRIVPNVDLSLTDKVLLLCLAIGIFIGMIMLLIKITGGLKKK